MRTISIPVDKTTVSCELGAPCPAFSTPDSYDGTLLHVVQHPDTTVSVFINLYSDGTQEAVMSRQQAKEFFTLALTLC